jgi:hypothetical protein
MTEASTDPVCACGVTLSRHNAFHWQCSHYRPFKVDMSADSAAARAGANSAATKRARGQELIPKLHLKGSKHRARIEELEEAPS